MISAGNTQVVGGQPGASSVADPLAQKPEKSKLAFGTRPPARASEVKAIASSMLDTVLPNPVVNAIATAVPPIAGSALPASNLSAVVDPPVPPVAPLPPAPPSSLLLHPIQAMDEAKRAVLKIAVRMGTSQGLGLPPITTR